MIQKILEKFLIGKIFKSKKFWYTIIGVLTNFFSENLGLDPAQTQNILLSIGALVLGQGFADLGKEANINC